MSKITKGRELKDCIECILEELTLIRKLMELQEERQRLIIKSSEEKIESIRSILPERIRKVFDTLTPDNKSNTVPDILHLTRKNERNYTNE